MNKIMLTGNVVKDAEVRFLADGTPVCNLRFAVREPRKKDDSKTLFLDLVIWGKRAEVLGPMLKKGKSLLVTGRLDVSKREADEKTYTNIRVYLDELEFLGKKEDSAEQSGDPIAAREPQDPMKEEVPF